MLADVGVVHYTCDTLLALRASHCRISDVLAARIRLLGLRPHLLLVGLVSDITDRHTHQSSKKLTFGCLDIMRLESKLDDLLEDRRACQSLSYQRCPGRAYTSTRSKGRTSCSSALFPTLAWRPGQSPTSRCTQVKPGLRAWAVNHFNAAALAWRRCHAHGDASSP